MAPAAGDRSLENTPTWSVAVVCTLFVLVSFVGERTLHYLGHWLSRTKRKPLYEALEKMKEELMLLGFISLLITVTAPSIAKICVNTSFYDKHFMPCKPSESKKKPSEGTKDFLINRRLTEYFMEQAGIPRRELAAIGNQCPEGKEPFITFLGLEQLHRFLFVMGCTHVFYSCLTMLLAMIKVYRWRRWENESREMHNNQQNMAEMCRNLTMRRQSTFVAYHSTTPGSKNAVFLWVICFFRQFGQTVTRSDYLALRLGFITKHTLPQTYDFHDYMLRSMEEEFKQIVGISPLFWLFVVIFMLVNIDVERSHIYFWISFAPVLMVLLVGAKLQKVIAQLALENSGLSGPLTGVNLRPRDSLFWFNRPRLLLHLIHFILFQDAFELATFIWVWWQFGWSSCLMSDKAFVFIRLVSGFLVQVLCSYSTLPLYALVTQMGSKYKKTIFKENVIESLHNWKNDATERIKKANHPTASSQPDAPPPAQDFVIDEDEDEQSYRFRPQSSIRSTATGADVEIQRNDSAPATRRSDHRRVEMVASPFMTPADALLSPKLP